MKIYSFCPEYDDKGFNRFLGIGLAIDHPDAFSDAIRKNGAVSAAWERVDWGFGHLPEGSLLAVTRAGFCGKRVNFEALSQCMEPNRGVLTLNGLGGDYVLVSPTNINPSSGLAPGLIPHMFMDFPRHLDCLVTELFRQEWLSRGFTGATFKEVGEMEDRLFVLLDPQSNPPVGT